jgi:hypothetical protein
MPRQRFSAKVNSQPVVKGTPTSPNSQPIDDLFSDEAAPLIQKSLEIQEEFYGESHPKVAMALNIAGVLEQRRGRYDAAERDFCAWLRSIGPSMETGITW